MNNYTNHPEIYVVTRGELQALVQVSVATGAQVQVHRIANRNLHRLCEVARKQAELIRERHQRVEAERTNGRRRQA